MNMSVLWATFSTLSQALRTVMRLGTVGAEPPLARSYSMPHGSSATSKATSPLHLVAGSKDAVLGSEILRKRALARMKWAREKRCSAARIPTTGNLTQKSMQLSGKHSTN